MKIGLNGCLVEEKEAVISVFDHGFMYGMGCFETFRTYGGQPFLFDAHMDRLEDSLRAVGIAANIDRPAARELIRALIETNGLTEAYIRYAVSAGAGAVGLPNEDYAAPNTIVYVKPLPPIADDDEPSVRPLQVLRLPRNTPEGERRIKSFHYMNNILGKREITRYPWAAGAEGLFLTADGHVAEGIVSNVFFVVDGRVMTPPLNTGILAGVTRGFVLELLQALGIPAAEETLTLQDAVRAQEVFLTNSIQEIVRVDRIFDPNGDCIWRFPGDEHSDAAKRLFAAYRQAVKGAMNG